jgi:pyruvate/2-oxoglutarate dehydrogenase complex dihydrolipoamide dehydrogenase (E3) component
VEEVRLGSTDNFDLIVIGCGPAGEKAGAQAAYFGKRVAVIERAEHMGGSCINTGTVPSKTLRESALYFSGLKQPLRHRLFAQRKSHRSRLHAPRARSRGDGTPTNTEKS